MLNPLVAKTLRLFILLILCIYISQVIVSYLQDKNVIQVSASENDDQEEKIKLLQEQKIKLEDKIKQQDQKIDQLDKKIESKKEEERKVALAKKLEDAQKAQLAKATQQAKVVAQSTTQNVAKVSTTAVGGIQAIINSVAGHYKPGDTEFVNIITAIVKAESGGRSNAVGDHGCSYGLLQANRCRGRGMGHSAEDLMNPQYNLEIAMGEFVAAYNQGVSQGIHGPNLVAFVSRSAQRPAPGHEWAAAKYYGARL